MLLGELTLMQILIAHVSKVLSMKSFYLYDMLCLLFVYFLTNYRQLSWITSVSSYALHYYIIKIVLVACQSKNYIIILYLLEDEYELSLGMLIRLKRIYNF